MSARRVAPRATRWLAVGLELADRREADSGSAEVAVAEPADQPLGPPRRIGMRHAGPVQAQRRQLAPDGAPPRRQLDGEHGAQREDPTGAEVPPAGEVAQRVGDQSAAVDLHPAQDVRARAQHEIGARGDRGVREAPQVAPVLAEGVLVPVGDVQPPGALGAAVEEHDHDRRPARRGAHERADARGIVERRAPGVGGEAHERHGGARRVAHADLARRAGRADARAPQRRPGPAVAGGAEVERMVVGDVHEIDAGAAERRGVGRGRLEGKAVATVRAAALGRAAGAEGALVVDGRDVGPAQHAGHRRQLGPAARRREAVRGPERDVAAPRDRHRRGGRWSARPQHGECGQDGRKGAGDHAAWRLLTSVAAVRVARLVADGARDLVVGVDIDDARLPGGDDGALHVERAEEPGLIHDPQAPDRRRLAEAERVCPTEQQEAVDRRALVELVRIEERCARAVAVAARVDRDVADVEVRPVVGLEPVRVPGQVAGLGDADERVLERHGPAALGPVAHARPVAGAPDLHAPQRVAALADHVRLPDGIRQAGRRLDRAVLDDHALAGAGRSRRVEQAAAAQLDPAHGHVGGHDHEVGVVDLHVLEHRAGGLDRHGRRVDGLRRPAGGDPGGVGRREAAGGRGRGRRGGSRRGAGSAAAGAGRAGGVAGALARVRARLDLRAVVVAVAVRVGLARVRLVLHELGAVPQTVAVRVVPARVEAQPVLAPVLQPVVIGIAFAGLVLGREVVALLPAVRQPVPIAIGGLRGVRRGRPREGDEQHGKRHGKETGHVPPKTWSYERTGFALA